MVGTVVAVVMSVASGVYKRATASPDGVGVVRVTSDPSRSIAPDAAIAAPVSDGGNEAAASEALDGSDADAPAPTCIETVALAATAVCGENVMRTLYGDDPRITPAHLRANVARWNAQKTCPGSVADPAYLIGLLTPRSEGAVIRDVAPGFAAGGRVAPEELHARCEDAVRSTMGTPGMEGYLNAAR